MDKKTLLNRISVLNDKESLLNLLNEIALDEFGAKASLFTMKQIDFFCHPENSELSYHNFTIPKKSGKLRSISSPCNSLKSLQQLIYVLLDACYVPYDCVNGFVTGKSVKDNAKNHVGQNYVFNIDLKDFFSSIDRRKVNRALMESPYCLSFEIANVISGICTMNKPIETDNNYVLPQGAPTSPILSNIVCIGLDRSLQSLAKRYNLNYSRYADDITFSSMHYVYGKKGSFLTELNNIIEKFGLSINPGKTRLQKKSDRQEVTGLTVSTKVNVSRKYYKQVRALIFIWEKYGYMTAQAKVMTHGYNHNSNSNHCINNLDRVVRGKLNFLSMVRGENDSALQKLWIRFENLCKLQNPVKTKYGLKFYDSIRVSDFRRLSNYNLRFFLDRDNAKRPCLNIVGDGRRIYCVVSSRVNFPAETDDLYLTVCEKHSRRFLMLTQEPSAMSRHEWTSEQLMNVFNVVTSMLQSKDADISVEALQEISFNLNR